MKITSTQWFPNKKTGETIGIVLQETEKGKKARIGVSKLAFTDKAHKADEEILTKGTKFPVKVAEALFD